MSPIQHIITFYGEDTQSEIVARCQDLLSEDGLTLGDNHVWVNRVASDECAARAVLADHAGSDLVATKFTDPATGHVKWLVCVSTTPA